MNEYLFISELPVDIPHKKPKPAYEKEILQENLIMKFEKKHCNRKLTLWLMVKILVLILITFSGALCDVVKGTITQLEKGTGEIEPGFSFMFDPKGVPSIAYFDSDQGILKFASVQKGSWSIEEVETTGNTGKKPLCSLGFTKTGNPVVLYTGKNNSISLAEKTGDNWMIEEIGKLDSENNYLSLFISGDLGPVATYNTKEGLTFTRRTAGAWDRQVVDKAGGKNMVTVNKEGRVNVYYLSEAKEGDSILNMATLEGNRWNIIPVSKSKKCTDFDVCMGKKGAPSVVYVCDSKILILKETVPGSGIWREELVGEEKGTIVSVVQKNDGFPSVAYITSNGKDLKISTFNGASWEEQKAASARGDYRFLNSTIMADAKDRLLLVIHDGDSLNVLLQQGTGWKIGRIDGRIRSGGFIQAAGSGDRLGAAYYDYTRKKLRFSSLKDGKWIAEIADTLGDVGADLSLAYDSAGNPGIAYHDKTLEDLKYAWKNGGVWRWDRVDSQWNVGHNTSLAFDGKDQPHISYYNQTSSFLKYAVKADGKWKRERIIKLNEYGRQSCIFVKPDGKPMVVFVDGRKEEKAREGESPVKTYIKTAIQDSAKPGQWINRVVLGPYAVDIKTPELSGDISPQGNIGVSFIDREGRLRVMRGDSGQEGEWSNDEVAQVCWGKTSTRYNSDGSLGVLYLGGETADNARLYFARYDGKNWSISEIDLKGRKTKTFSLADSPAGKISFAFEDAESIIPCFFRQ